MRTLSPFLGRRPWVAGLVGLILGPVIGMLYLGRGHWALCYIGIWATIYVIPLTLAHIGMLPFEAATITRGLWIAFRLGGAGHCYSAAAQQRGALPTVWFARWYAVVSLGVVLPLCLHFFVWELFNIPSANMEPSLSVGDHFVVSKLPYLLGEPERGDLVVFLPPREESPYAKRLIGLPGDRIQMKQGSLFINDQGVPRDEVEENRLDPGPGEAYRERLPSGRSYLVRERSDSMPLDDTEVFEVPLGHYFFLGDNRDNSLDSRNIIGFVPRENLIGPVVLIYWNSEAQKFRFEVPE